MNNYKLSLSIDPKMMSQITNFALQNHLDRNLFTFNGPARQFCILNQTITPVSSEVFDFRITTYKKLNIGSFNEEPFFGIFLGVNNETGFVYEHKDPTQENFIHTRINFLLSKPHQGGMPIINHQEFDVDEGECWLNLASEWYHSSSPVVGNKPRVVLSLGALVRKKIMDPILQGLNLDILGARYQ